MKMGGVIAALVSGAVLAVSRDTGHLGFLVLIGPVPLFLHVLGERRALNTFVLAYLVGLMAEAGPLYFYGGIIPMVYGIVALQALFFCPFCPPDVDLISAKPNPCRLRLCGRHRSH